MRYTDPKDILVLHARVIEETGGGDGVRDLSSLLSACARPQATFDGKELYTTVFQKAAALMESLARNHLFIDGNKRTAFVSTALFLHQNGYEIDVPQQTVVSFVIKVASGEADVQIIATWLEKYSRETGT